MSNLIQNEPSHVKVLHRGTRRGSHGFVRKSSMGFTLMELLVVIGIIAILGAILIPTINRAMKKAEFAKAQAVVSNLDNAWRAYYLEYEEWPPSITGSGPYASNILRGDVSPNNKKGKRFMEFAADSMENGDLRDPWGNRYIVRLDTDYDGQISGTPDGTLYRDVAVWSSGPDGIGSGKEYPKSWK